jgi:hypothetical protein
MLQTDDAKEAKYWYRLSALLLYTPCAYLIKHYATKAYGGVDVQFHVFLASALVRGDWSASRPGRFTSGEKPRYPLDKRLGGPQNRSGQYGDSTLPRLEHRSLDRPARSLSLCRLQFNFSVFVSHYFHWLPSWRTVLFLTLVSETFNFNLLWLWLRFLFCDTVKQLVQPISTSVITFSSLQRTSLFSTSLL